MRFAATTDGLSKLLIKTSGAACVSGFFYVADFSFIDPLA